MMPKVETDKGKGVTINIGKASGTVVVGDSASVTNHFHDGEAQAPVAGQGRDLIEKLISEVAKSRAVDPRSIEDDLARTIGIADISLIQADQIADVEGILTRWREEAIKEAVDAVMEALGSFENEGAPVTDVPGKA